MYLLCYFFFFFGGKDAILLFFNVNLSFSQFPFYHSYFIPNPEPASFCLRQQNYCCVILYLKCSESFIDDAILTGVDSYFLTLLYLFSYTVRTLHRHGILTDLTSLWVATGVSYFVCCIHFIILEYDLPQQIIKTSNILVTIGEKQKCTVDWCVVDSVNTITLRAVVKETGVGD